MSDSPVYPSPLWVSGGATGCGISPARVTRRGHPGTPRHLARTIRPVRRPALVLTSAFLLVAVAAGCSDDDGGAIEEADPTTTAPAAAGGDEEPTTTSTAVEDAEGYVDVVTALADDAMEGRDNLTPGSDAAQAYLVGELEGIGEPVPGGDGYRHAFAEGTNLLALIPGTSNPGELIVLGAHYDHLGRDCPTATPGDDICNGAADNAAGVASVLEIGRRLAEDPPARSVLIALWDAEEDGLLGSAAFVAAPPIDLTTVAAYLNWDIQGVNLLPSLADVTVVVGAETGGPVLSEAALAAGDTSSLDTADLSLLFGQGRSDHASFAGVGVPTVFFTDANSACYHTSQDDLVALDLEKLGLQIDIGHALAVDLANRADRPTFVADAPVATFDDAVTMQRIVTAAQPDLGRFEPDDRAVVEQFLADLDAMVAAGAVGFDAADVGVLLGGSATLVDLLTEGACDAFTG
jgi:hypothetical protein